MDLTYIAFMFIKTLDFTRVHLITPYVQKNNVHVLTLCFISPLNNFLKNTWTPIFFLIFGKISVYVIKISNKIKKIWYHFFIKSCRRKTVECKIQRHLANTQR